MGVCPGLPVQGIQVIFGNDLAGYRMWGNPPASGDKWPEGEDVAQTSQGSAACVVTRAQSHTASSGDLATNKIPVKTANVFFPVPDWSLNLTRSDVIKEQQNDPSLEELFKQVRSVEELLASVQGYFLEDG